MSVAKVKTVAFSGIDAIKVDVQVHIGPGLPFFTIVGLPDKSIAEAKERIRAVFNVIGISLPPKRITVNMSPASLQKEGSHYDLPIAVAILVAMDIVPQSAVENWILLGELALDGAINKVPGVLMAAMFANSYNHALVCPFVCAKEARIAGFEFELIAVKQILELVSYIKGEYTFPHITECLVEDLNYSFDMSDVKGQLFAKRALEIAAAGSFHMLLIGPPGVGKSMLAKRMVTILPPLSVMESIEVTMIYSIANKLGSKLKRNRPYREPHYNASLASLVGGGAKAMPGEISLAHNGVLFLDELGEYSKALEGLRQSMESGKVTISRAQNHITYPANAQIIAAMNPCKCGYLGTEKECRRAPVCGQEYQKKISGPIMDRFDIVIHMDNIAEFTKDHTNQETSENIRRRVVTAIDFQKTHDNRSLNEIQMEDLNIDDDGMDMLVKFCEEKHSNRRNFDKIARVARVIANLDDSLYVNKKHIAEAIMYRRNS